MCAILGFTQWIWYGSSRVDKKKMHDVISELKNAVETCTDTKKVKALYTYFLAMTICCWAELPLRN